VLGLDLCRDPGEMRVVQHTDGDHGQIAAGVAVDSRRDGDVMFLRPGEVVDASVGALRVRSNH
jgi:hypothetical protein